MTSPYITSYHTTSHHITSQLLRSSEMKSWIEQFGRFILLREAQLIVRQHAKHLVALMLLVKLQNVHERKKILAFLNQTSCFKIWGKRANVVYILCSMFCILYSVFWPFCLSLCTIMSSKWSLKSNYPVHTQFFLLFRFFEHRFFQARFCQ